MGRTLIWLKGQVSICVYMCQQNPLILSVTIIVMMKATPVTGARDMDLSGVVPTPLMRKYARETTLRMFLQRMRGLQVHPRDISPNYNTAFALAG